MLAWDVGHNPLGRAYIMAQLLQRHFDVEIWGAQFERYGDHLWAPLREPELPIHVFDGRELPDHLDVIERVGQRIDADLLWVSKPRFPSYALGAAAKQARNRPLVLDVDDHELAFFGEDDGLDLDALASVPPGELALPFERAWTRACDRLIDLADQITVSNVALQERFGGVIVPHARDERRFDPARYDRDEIRARLGVAPSDRLLLFGGTPRIHKGVLEVLEALDRLGDSRYRLALFGTKELADLRDRLGHLDRWVLPLPYRPFQDLAPLVAAADLSCVLQDPTHPVARFQMPAKVSDALAMAVPCLVTGVPPLRPLIDAGVLHEHRAGDALHEQIARILDDPDTTADQAQRGRQLFLAEYSYQAVSDRLEPLFRSLLDDPLGPTPGLATLLTTPRRLLGPTRADDSAPSSADRESAPRRPGSRRWRRGLARPMTS